MDDEPATANVDHAPLEVHTFVESLSDQIEVSVDAKKEHEMEAFRAKARKVADVVITSTDRARYPLVITFTWVFWLIATFLLIDAGALTLRALLLQGHCKAEGPIGDTWTQTSLLGHKRDVLQDIYLHRHFLDDHQKCLVRAADIAHQLYGDLPYQHHPDILADTAKWAQEQCDRIILTPISIPTGGWAKYWMMFKSNAERALYHLKDVAGGWLNVKRPPTQKVTNREAKTVTPSLPSIYFLVCNDAGSFCTLSFKTLSEVTTFVQPSHQAIKLEGKQQFIARVIDVCTKVHSLAGYVQRVIPWMNLFWFVCSAFAIIRDVITDNPLKKVVLFKIILSFLVELVLLVAYFQHQEICEKASSCQPISVLTYIVPGIVTIVVLVPFPTGWHLRLGIDWDLSWALGELRTVCVEVYHGIADAVQDGAHEETAETNEQADPKPTDVAENKQTLEPSQTPSAVPSPGFKVSPKTTLHEDIQKMRAHLHRGENVPVLADTGRPEGSDSDEGWEKVTSADNKNVESSDDEATKESAGDSLNDKAEGLDEGITGVTTEQSTTCKCGVCGRDGDKSTLLLCDNADCPLQWGHAKCMGVAEDLDQLVVAMGPTTWLCPMCSHQLADIITFRK